MECKFLDTYLKCQEIIIAKKGNGTPDSVLSFLLFLDFL